MKTFSEFEKKIIERMIELDENTGSLNVLGNIFDSFSNELSLPDYCYIMVTSKTDVSIQIKKDILDKITPSNLGVIDDNISKFLLTSVKLFEYLENNSLCYFMGNLDLTSLGQVWADTQYETCDFLEDESKKLIYKYTKNKIYITEELRELAKNNFKSREQIRHEEILAATKQELLVTRIILALTFCGLVASILIPLLSTSKVEINEKIKVEILDLTLSSIVKEVKGMASSVDRVGNKINKLRSDMPSIIRRVNKASNNSKNLKTIR